MIYFTLVVLVAMATPGDSRDRKAIDSLSRFEPHAEYDADGKCVELSIGAPAFSDEDLKIVGTLADLQTLFIHESKITDEGLLALTNLNNIQFLILKDNARIKGPGLAHLKGLTQLQSLRLIGCPIDDEGVRHISASDKLISLTLSRTNITDAALVHLKKWPNLQHLFLSKTKVTNEGMKHVVKLRNLEAVHLSQTLLDDGCMEGLSSLQTLTWLNISGTRVSDMSVGQIAKLDRLRVIIIRDTAITRAGYDKLKNRFPSSVVD